MHALALTHLLMFSDFVDTHIKNTFAHLRDLDLDFFL